MFLSFAIILTSTISLACSVVFGQSLNLGYAGVWLLPFSFLIAYVTIYRSLFSDPNIRMTVGMVLGLSWIRYVLAPFFGCISSAFSSLAYISSIESTQLGIALMVYEQLMIVVCIFAYATIRRRPQQCTSGLKPKLKLRGSRTAYVIYICFALVVYLVLGRNLDLFQFAVLSVEETTRRGDITHTSVIIVRQIISSGMLCLFFVFVESCRKFYDRTGNTIFVNYGLLSAFLLIGTISGERRTALAYTTFSSAWVLLNVFPNKKRKVVLTVSFIGIGLIFMMSIYKFFNAFLYGSYVKAMQNADIDLDWIALTLDSYFCGIRTVSRNLGYALVSQKSVTGMFFDFVRSIFGLSFLAKGMGLTTSELYNLFIYRGLQSTGHLLSSIGYGYHYLGLILAPLFTCFNVTCALVLESIFRKCKSVEMSYIASYVFARFAFGFFGNPAPLISHATTFFAVNGFVFLAALLLKPVFMGTKRAFGRKPGLDESALHVKQE